MAKKISSASALSVVMRPIGSVRPYDKNPRINDHAVAAVVASIEQFGWRQPIVVDKAGVIIIGHTRFKAAQKMGCAEVPVHVADLPPAKVRALRLADNKTGELAEWDNLLLGAELDALKADGFDLSGLGFEKSELAALLKDGGGSSGPDELPEKPKKAVAKLGDVWLLGDHRLCCGDATKAENVAEALGGRKPFMMVTDPPYGVDYDSEWRVRAGVQKRSVNKGLVLNDTQADWSPAWKLFGGAVCYVWHAGVFSAIVQAGIEAAGFDIRAQIIWNKDVAVFGRGDYHWKHEPCWYGVRSGLPARRTDDRKQTTVWDIACVEGKQSTIWNIQQIRAVKDNPEEGGYSGHGTQKPVECMARPIRNHGAAGDEIYDGFCGSGTTIIACEMLGRKCSALELDPGYVDMIVARWEKFTGRKAKRA